MIFKGATPIIPMKYVNPSGFTDFGLRWIPRECYKHFPTWDRDSTNQLYAVYHVNYATTRMPSTYSYTSIPWWSEKGNDISYHDGTFPGVSSRITMVEYEKATSGNITDYFRWFAPKDTYDYSNYDIYRYVFGSGIWLNVPIESNTDTSDHIDSYVSGGYGYNPTGSPAIWTGEVFTKPYTCFFAPARGTGTKLRLRPYAVLCLENWTTNNTWGIGFLTMSQRERSGGSLYWLRWYQDDGTNWQVTRSGWTTRLSTGFMCESTVVDEWTNGGNNYKIVVVKPSASANWVVDSSYMISRPFVARRGAAANGAVAAIMCLGCEYITAE